ncbi:MAG: ABC transporter ATP-binding protein [Chloroflexi bacterium]|nr:ABC transporter ATP-binding protein [Chloroflexota bacterium]
MMPVVMEPIIKIHGLGKVYQSKERAGLFRSRVKEISALKDVNLDIFPGESFGLLGPNGAGKTTLIKCLTTLLLPTHGTAWLNGYQLERDENAIRASIGCMLMGERGLYWKLTGRENLEFFGALYQIPPDVCKRQADKIIALLNLGDIIDRAVETFSSGQKMKLAFAKALLNDAPILILDEPTNTLDLPSARELRGIVRELNRQGRTVVYTTHVMSEAEELCDRVAIIDRGQVIALGTIAELKASLNREGVTKVEGVIPEDALRAVHAIDGVASAALSSNNGLQELVVVSPNPRALLPLLIRALMDNGAVLEQIAPTEVTLEDVFIAKTGRTLAEDTRVK